MKTANGLSLGHHYLLNLRDSLLCLWVDTLILPTLALNYLQGKYHLNF